MHGLRWARMRCALLLLAGLLVLDRDGSAQADFFLGGGHFRDDGTRFPGYGQGLFGIGEPLYTEEIDATGVSADGKVAYVFGNDLGRVTNFAFNFETGEYLGTRGVRLPRDVHGDLEEGFQISIGIQHPLSRSNVPLGGGDLFYIGTTTLYYPRVDLLNVVDTTSGDVITQIVPASPTPIYDFALSPGDIGPQSRVYLATEHGIEAYEEQAVFDWHTHKTTFSFEHAFSIPLTGANSRPLDIEVGPDGLIYLLQRGSFDIVRLDRQTGEFVDTFLSGEDDALSNGASWAPLIMRFGPGGDLYLHVFDWPVTRLWRYDIASGQRRGEYIMQGGFADSFFVLHDPVPEPASFVLALLGGAIFCRRLRR